MLFIRKIMWALLAAPGAAILVALAVANRHNVVLKLDPLRPDNPAIVVNLPLYASIYEELHPGQHARVGAPGEQRSPFAQRAGFIDPGQQVHPASVDDPGLHAPVGPEQDPVALDHHP